jgi:hypothetical protein
MVIALQVAGVDAQQVAAATGLDVTSMKQTTLAGKTVWQGGSDALATILYPKDDIAFEVLFADATTAQAILAALP